MEHGWYVTNIKLTKWSCDSGYESNTHSLTHSRLNELLVKQQLLVFCWDASGIVCLFIRFVLMNQVKCFHVNLIFILSVFLKTINYNR